LEEEQFTFPTSSFKNAPPLNMSNVITINATVRKKATLTELPEDIFVQVFCKDNYAVASFSNKKFGKKLFKLQKRLGKKVTYNERLGLIIERIQDKTATEIAKQMSAELKKEGGDVTWKE